MPEQLESKLTTRTTYQMARDLGFGRLTSAYLALPVGIENFAKASREILTPTLQIIQVDEKAKTYHIVEEKVTLKNPLIEPYADILERRGYTRI